MDRIRLLRLTTIPLITLLTLNIILAIVYGATANAYPYHPQVKVYGQVTKPVYVGRSIWEYRDDDGLSSFLPFKRQDENITISFHQIVFETQFLNQSIGKASTTSSTELTGTAESYTLNQVPVIYLKAVNNTALTADTLYNFKWTLNVEKEVTNDYYLYATVKLAEIGDASVAKASLYIAFTFKDSGATKRTLYIKFTTETGTDVITTIDPANSITYISYSATTPIARQIKIQTMLDKAGYSWDIVKLEQIAYELYIRTASSLSDDNIGGEAYIYATLLPSSKIYIDDGTETGLAVNGTSGQFPPSAGDVIQIYGANATKISSVSIPFQMEDTRPIEERVTTIPQSYGFQYEWRFVMPKSPSETGDKFSYSNTNITLYCWFDGAYIKNLWVNGVDKTSAVSGKKTPTTTGLSDSERYWTYGLASSLVGGNQYDIEMRVEDLPSDVWYALTQEPQKILTWSWFYDRILAIIQAILNFLGFSVTSIELKRRELRVPKAS